MVVHEQVFLGPPWTKLFAKSLFLVVHEQLYGIVQQHAFIPRWWTPPNSLADYLEREEKKKKKKQEKVTIPHMCESIGFGPQGWR